jgi:dihydrofolate synthase / folylpolyglutamate synthase
MSDEGGPTPKLIVVTGSVGRSSIATMVAAMLHACGEGVVHLNGHWLHSPLERISLDGSPLQAETAEALLGGPRRPLNDHAVDEVVEPLLRQSGASWLVVSGIPPPTGEAALLVVAPIVPYGDASAAQQADSLLDGLPMFDAQVCAPQRESVLDVLRPAFPNLIEVAQRCHLSRERTDLDGQQCRLKTDRAEYRLRLPVLGSFQVENAATAILAVESLAAEGETGPQLDQTRAQGALESLRLQGRMEVIKRRPLVVVDSGSAGAAIRRVGEALREIAGGRRPQIILDPSSDLEPTETVQTLANLDPDLVIVSRSLVPAWMEASRELGVPIRTSVDVATAVDLAMETASDGDVIAVLGSRAAAAAARAHVLALLPADLRLN